MDDAVTINEINFNHHPAPWRMEEAPKGWGDSTVVFDANNECVYHELYPIKSKRETWENIIRLVNQKQIPERVSVEEVARLRLAYKTMQEQNANMQSALEIAIEVLDEYNESSTIRDIKSVWRDGINGLEDWRKYEDAFDEDQIANQ